jgi:hypothetical protein
MTMTMDTIIFSLPSTVNIGDTVNCAMNGQPVRLTYATSERW